MNIQIRDNFFTAGAHAIKKIKIFRVCSRFQTIPQMFSTIEIVNVVVTIEQQNIFRSDFLFLFNNLNIFRMNSNSFIRAQVRVQKKYFFEFGKMTEFFRVQVGVRNPGYQPHNIHCINACLKICMLL